MICLDCQGTGQSEALHETLTCSRCGGAGLVPDEMAEWIERGEELFAQRKACRVTCRELGERMGVTPSRVMDWEYGRVRNLDVNYSEYLEA